MRHQLSCRSIQLGCRSCIATACRRRLTSPQSLSRLSLRSALSARGRFAALQQSTPRRSAPAALAAAFSSQRSSPSSPPASSAPEATVIAYQDMGRNQPKLTFLASPTAPSTASGSLSSPPQPQELRITQQQQSKTAEAKTDKERVGSAATPHLCSHRQLLPLPTDCECLLRR
jgi:hypothetical protein